MQNHRKMGNKMKGIILAGGTGSRLYPLTKVTNKHLLPIGSFPMIHYPIISMTNAGIKDIMIISGTGHVGDMINFLGSEVNTTVILLLRYKTNQME